MNSLVMVDNIIKEKKYDVITEYARIAFDRTDLVVKEYNGEGVRLFKDNGNTVMYVPSHMTTIQEGHVAQAIANGTIFDDAESIDNTATMIERTTLPVGAMINCGKDTPKAVKPMIAVIIGKMDDNGSFNISDADITNGINLVKDLMNKDNKSYDVMKNYTGEKDEFLPSDIRNKMTDLEKDKNDVNDVDIADIIDNDDIVEDYDDFDIEAIESDEGGDITETETEEDNDSKPSDEKEDVSEEDVEEEVEECGDVDTSTVNEEDESSADEMIDDEEVVTEDDKPLDSNEVYVAVNPVTASLIEKRKTVLKQESFLSKRPKKLKPITRDLIAYITSEMNDIHSANDQAMLSGYTCSKIELVDFYIVALETNDARYIVPHNKQYLVWMKSELERLLSQILRIRPVNRSEQIWRINYPQMA